MHKTGMKIALMSTYGAYTHDGFKTFEMAISHEEIMRLYCQGTEDASTDHKLLLINQNEK